MAKYKTADGTEHDLGDGVTDAQIKAISTIAADAAAAAVGGATKSLTDSIGAALAPISTRLEAIEKAGQAPSSKPKGKAAEGEDDPVLASIGELTKRVETLTQERESERGRAETERRVTEYLNRTRPNMTPQARKRLTARLVAAAPKDETALAAATKDALDELSDYGVDVARLNTASPAAEGATKPPASDTAAAKARKLEEIRTHKPSTFVPAS